MKRILTLQHQLLNALPWQRRNLEKSFSDMDEKAKMLLIKYIDVAQENGDSIEDLVDGYVYSLKKINEEQVYFFRNQYTYRYESSKDFRTVVYDDPDYMKKYMMGLALSMFLWPQHRDLHMEFRKFLARISSIRCKGYLEIGAGCGLYAVEAMNTHAFSHYDFVDISETSLMLTQRMIHEMACEERKSFYCEDIMQFSGSDYSLIVANGIIQTLEDPGSFLAKCCSMMNSNGYFFLTASLNSPMPDVVYRFSSADHMKELCYQAGFQVDNYLCVPYIGYTLRQCEKEHLPINIVAILKRKTI